MEMIFIELRKSDAILFLGFSGISWSSEKRLSFFYILKKKVCKSETIEITFPKCSWIIFLKPLPTFSFVFFVFPKFGFSIWKHNSNSSPANITCFPLKREIKGKWTRGSEKGIKRGRRSRRIATPSPERETSGTRIDSPERSNLFLTNSNLNTQESLGEPYLENQLREPSQISDEIQVWIQIVEQKNTGRKERMMEEMASKLGALLKEIKCNKGTSVATNPRSDVNEIQEQRPSGSRIDPSIWVRASNIETSDSENGDDPLRSSEKKDLKRPAKLLFRSESDVHITIHSDEESDIEKDYHMVTGANQQLHRQRS